MSIQITGTVERKGLGPGTWALVTPDKTYELKNAPSDLKKTDLKAKVKGKIREDVMSFAMIGPVLEVESFEALE